jgi:hypothetical protein
VGEEKSRSLTTQEYRARLRSLGLTPANPSYEGATLHVDRDGMHHSIPDPESLSPEQRAAFLDLLVFGMGLDPLD